MIRRWLIAGLLVWLPLVVTYWLLKILVGVLDNSLLLLPDAVRPENLLGFPIPGLGIVLSLLLVLATGALAANFVGRRVVGLGESMLNRIPFVRTVYSGVKRLAETVLGDSGTSFRKVLLIEYPRRDMWTLAFQTGEPIGEIQERTAREVLTVFVPTTPNPTSGFIVMLPKEDVIELDMSVEDGLRMVISIGVVTPEQAAQAAADGGNTLPTSGATA